MNNVKLVVCDMAGTTVQDKKEVETCFAKACKKTRLVVSEERILALQGYSKIEVFKKLWEEKTSTNHPDYDDNVQFSYLTFKDILETHYINSEIKPTEGCLETFAFLKDNNVKIALTTGFYREVANIILTKLGWLVGLNSEYISTTNLSVIQASVTSDEVARGRPEADMIFRAMELLEIRSAAEVINIGDTPSDLISGNKAGCLRTLGLTNGTHTFQQLKPFANDGLLPQLDALIPIIQKLNSQDEI